MSRKLLRALATAGALALLTGGVTVGTVGTAPPAAAETQICEKFGSVRVQGGKYIVQNNEWGDNIGQCIVATDSGLRYASGYHNVPTNGAPAGYPSIYAGCHYGNCTTGSGLPLQVSAMGNVRSSVRYTTPNDGQWNASYDLWFDPNPNQSGQNVGAELMIWGSKRGAPQPAGSKVGTATLEGAVWDVWVGRFSWNVISYVRQQPTNSLDLNLTAFTNDAANRGQVDRSWYLTSAQFGFEPWQGGPGLSADGFTFTTNGGGGGGGGTTSIIGQGSNRCVDVAGGQTGDGTTVQLWDCLGNPAQQWRRSGNTFVNPNSGKCLDVRGQGTANGTQVWLWTCLSNPAQQWEVRPNGTIVNPNSGKCLDAVERGTGNGTRLQIWECGSPQPNQLWRLG